MAVVYLGRFNRWIEKLLNIKGGPTTVDFEPSVRMSIPMDKGVDHRYLEGWNRFATTAQTAAVAANFSRIRIRNPVGSNVIIVMEQILFINVTTADTPFITYGATVTDLANIVSLTFTRMDPRGNPQPTAIVSQNSQAAGGVPLLQRTTATNTTADFITNANQEIPVLPGQVLDVVSQIANNVAIVTLMWRERALENSELA